MWIVFIVTSRVVKYMHGPASEQLQYYKIRSIKTPRWIINNDKTQKPPRYDYS